MALEKLQGAFSSDALIQAAMDRLGLTDEKFTALLTNELFSDLIAALKPRRSEGLIVSALTSRHVGYLRKSEWQEFIDELTFCFPTLTALPLAKSLAQLLEGPSGPSAILSFNAEALFAALINAFLATTRGVRAGDKIDYVVHATSDRKAGRIPYVFCHGLLPVPGATGRHLSSVDKLVFQESSYLQLANTSFSWQSTSFLRAASGSTIVFIGVSLTDPNMRRWLAWAHSTRVAELTEAGSPAPTSTPHYWIARTNGDLATERWTESVVSHLGIRLVWVREFSEIAPTLDAMAS